MTPPVWQGTTGSRGVQKPLAIGPVGL